MSHSLLLIGASVRAAAQSAVRAGFRPLAIDMFADRDLRVIGPTIRVARYPAGLPAAALELPPAPLIYVGAMENHPDVVARLARRRTLCGNGADVLRRVRDPFCLARSLRAVGIEMPELRHGPSGLPRNGSWLRKPYRGSGGRSVVPWDEAAPAVRSGEVYFQRRVEGVPCAGLYVAAGGDAVLLGVSRQIIGAAWTGTCGFCYAGSIGPLRLSALLRQQFERMGERIAADFSLCGLFGVDAIISGDRVQPVEVNPRYPASAEVIERACGFATIGRHVDACRDGRLPPREASTPTRTAGKAILFARRELNVPTALVDWAETQNAGARWPAAADIPDAGTPVPAGLPIMTVLAEGADEAAVERLLRDRAARVDAILSDADR